MGRWEASAALLKDGEMLAAASEDRFTRKQGDASFPYTIVEQFVRIRR